MIDGILGWIEQLMGSAWVYPALFGMSLVDSVVPVFPSEAPLIMAGVYAGSTGTPSLPAVLLAAGLGAWIGDHLTFFLGRLLSGRVDAVPSDSRRGRAIAAARAMLDRRGGMALVVARFIPWGRIATTLVLGATRYPLRRFSAFDALGASLWALHGCLMGFIGGAAFENQPLKGLALGIGMAMAASVLIEVGRLVIARRRTARAARRPEPERAPADA
ncbi:DedA family protein [Luteipulveratus flavus]|uniref:DedA family protein n=1 Tax=Luteipulveratus flavus TaxID=3031728 RepID=A0ABT6CAH8_9MICO|nr:DedA family protein [Luteipulveratus sp. YIM 133296]MDF8265332.1 DedA family protein [Luteipulveratus sp. YIM 133296]